jgi:chaperonin GroES
MKVTPLGDRLLIKPTNSAEKTKGGLYIPNSAQEKTQEAEVIQIGDPNRIKVGDIVIYDITAGNVIDIDRVEHIIIEIEDILAIVE